MRPALSATLGGLAVVAGWAAWAMLAPADPPQAVAAADPAVATNTAVTPAASPQEHRAPAALVAASASTPAPAPRPAPALRAGQVMEHGMPTALQSLGDGGAPSAAPPAVALPPGARTEDAVVNPAGMVTLTRSATATGSDAATPPPRPATVERTH
jgi:hypothetical protein